jgi:hypothetical protein
MYHSYDIHVLIALKYESLNLLIPYGPDQVCTNIALPLPLPTSEERPVALQISKIEVSPSWTLVQQEPALPSQGNQHKQGQ